jgi:hypothetical protein
MNYAQPVHFKETKKDGSIIEIKKDGIIIELCKTIGEKIKTSRSILLKKSR